MTNQPLVSIVLPTYNGSRYIDQAIDSCLAQTYPAWELIIVDDGSTDDTPSKIRAYAERDGRIRSITHTRNQGLPRALNSGFAQAAGEFLTWTSDDNTYRPTALEEMASLLQEHNDVGIVYADYSVVDEAGGAVRHVTVEAPETLARRNCVGTCFLYRRAVYTQVGAYNEQMYLAEDYDFWLRASVSFRLAQLHKDLYVFRQNPASLTGTRMPAIQEATERAIRANLSLLTWMSRAQRAEALVALSKRAQHRGDVGMMRADLIRAVCLWPPALFSGLPIGVLLDAAVGKTTADRLRGFLGPPARTHK